MCIRMQSRNIYCSNQGDSTIQVKSLISLPLWESVTYHLHGNKPLGAKGPRWWEKKSARKTLAK
jgi:hypothetical protein